MEKPSHKFNTSIFPYANFIILPLYIIFIPLWIIGLFIIDVEASPEFALFLLLFLLGCIAVAYIASAFISLSTVSISPAGISGYNFWGGITRKAFVKWDEIEAVNPTRFFGLRYLRVFFNSQKLPLWIPLFFNNMEDFKKLAMQYSSEGNPIRGYFHHGSIHKSSAIGKNFARLIALVLIPFVIYTVSIVTYFQRAPIEDLVLQSAYSENLLKVIPIPKLFPSLCRFYIRNFSNFDINEEYGGFPLLHWASIGYINGDRDQRQHMLNLVNFFLDKGANPNALNKIGYSCLHIAVLRNSIELIVSLLDQGTDVNVRGKYKYKNLTPLGLARSSNKKEPKKVKPEVINLLLQNGAIE